MCMMFTTQMVLMESRRYVLKFFVLSAFASGIVKCLFLGLR